MTFQVDKAEKMLNLTFSEYPGFISVSRETNGLHVTFVVHIGKGKSVPYMCHRGFPHFQAVSHTGPKFWVELIEE